MYAADFLPRAAGPARKAIVMLTAVAAGVTLVFTTAFPTQQTSGQSGLTIVTCVLLLVIAAALAVVREPAPWMWAGYPFLATVAIAVLDVASGDASVTAQVFFFFPVLYAGSQLVRRAAVLVCAVAVGAEATVTVALLPAGRALVEASFVAAALCTVTALLVASAERTDVLIARLEQHAAIDPLTGLATRRVLDSAASSALQGAANEGGTALLLIDLDHFKQINDVHGHPTGDYALQQLAKLLRGVNRSSDLISRMGGDEIAVLMPGCALPAAMRRAEQILLEVRAARIDVGHCSMAVEADVSRELSISVSIGVAHMPTHAAEVHTLYAAADASLYSAKRAGRDRIGDLAGVRRLAA